MIDKRSKSNRDIFHNRIKLDARALHINTYSEIFPYVLISRIHFWIYFESEIDHREFYLNWK